MKKLLLVALSILFVVPAAFGAVMTYDWEDGGTVLALYGTGTPPMIVANVGAPDPVFAGLASCRLEDNSPTGTPNAYVAWVRGLTDGDVVVGSFWRYDITPTASPSSRIWGNWNDDPTDIFVYSGSASGNSDYGPGLGWDQTSFSWTVTDGHTGLVIHIRTYSVPGDTVWVDDLEVIYPDTATCLVPSAASAVENVTWGGIKALYR